MTQKRAYSKIDQLKISVNGVIEPTMNDVLYGRGGATNKHEGNRKFRHLCWKNHGRYQLADLDGKADLAEEMVAKWTDQSPPGRFLKQDRKGGLWYSVSEKDARRKASSTLREVKPGWAHFTSENLSNMKKPKPKAPKTSGIKRLKSLPVKSGQKKLNHITTMKKKMMSYSAGKLTQQQAYGDFGWPNVSFNSRKYIDGNDTDATAEESDSSVEGLQRSFRYAPTGTPRKEGFGDIGYAFKRQLFDENGRSLGWFEGLIVHVLPGEFRKCLYYANGFVEDLSLADLEELAQVQAAREVIS